MMEKLLPQNLEAERGVLGSIIIDPEAVSKVADFLAHDDFYRDAHRTIYSVIIDLYTHHQEADFLTICDGLERLNKLADVGGASYITGLINEVPTSGNAEYYGRIVERTAILRRLIHAAGVIAAVAYDEADASVALEKAEKLVYEIGRRAGRGKQSLSSMEAIMGEMLRDMEAVEAARLHGMPSGVPTGSAQLDTNTGGLQKSNLIILAARPSVGKTSMACNIARYAASPEGGDMPVLIFSLEMSKQELGLRYLSESTHIPSQKLRNASFDGHDDWNAISYHVGVLSELPIYVNDTPGITLQELRSEAHNAVAEHGIKLIVIDYLQLMSGASGGRHDNRQEVISELSRSIKGLARELDIPILLLSQLNRSVESRGDPEPQLSDLRESGAIEQDADIVWFLWLDREEQPKKFINAPYHVNLSVAKHRNGPLASLRYTFDPARTRFTDDLIGVIS